MRDPLRAKLKVVIFSTFGLLLSLGLATGFRSLQGSDPGIPSALAAPGRSDPATATDQSTQTPVMRRAQPAVAADPDALAAVSLGLVEIARALRPAVVSVDTRGAPQSGVPSPLEELFGTNRRQPNSQFDVPLGRGSGFIVSQDGYILTNNHVVARGERITVELLDGRSLPARLVGRDPTTDIAVLKIEADNLPTVDLGDSETAEIGELVMAIGNPGSSFGSALPFTVTTGIISAKGRQLGIIRQAAGGSNYAIEDLIQTDAVINPGNSGGPLVNYRGEVIGINTAIASVTGFYQGYGFAIPISLARDVMEDLIKYGRVRRAALGVVVAPVTRADARVYGLDSPHGILIQDFSDDDSPGRKAGLQRQDVIVAIEGRPVNRVGQLQRIVASYEPGEQVAVTIVRSGETKDIHVRLTEAPVPQVAVAAAGEQPKRSTTLLGVQVRNLTPEIAAEIGLSGEDLEGVVVTEVARFGPAASSGLGQYWLIHEVNGQNVRNVKEFDRALGKLQPGDVVSVDAVRAGEEGLLRRVFNFELPAR